jgi:hypothetical protein
MLPIGLPIYVDFRVVDNGSNPVTNLTAADFSIVFRRNNASCADPLNFHNYGDGTYTFFYTPSTPGHDYLSIYNAANDIRTLYTEDIVTPESIIGGSDSVRVDENYTGAGNLQVRQPHPENWTLLIFTSVSWNLGQRADSNATGLTTIDAFGNWNNPITVTPDRYHIVIRNGATVIVMKAYFEIPQ